MIPLLSFQGAYSVGLLAPMGILSTSLVIATVLLICPRRYCLSLSNAVLKSSRIMVSVKHLKTNASFQNGLSPSGKACRIILVTERQSKIMKAMDKVMARSRMPKRGDILTSSTRPNS